MQYNQKYIPRSVFLNLLIILVSLGLVLISCTSSGSNKAPNKVPTVSLTANPKTGEAALEVTFIATSNDPDGDNLTISWDFGDGQTEQGQTQRKHTYQNSGVYTVKVDVSDGKSGTASGSTQITVTAKNNDPEVTLTADKISGTAPLTVNFTANAFDVDNDNLTFSWDFGDGEDLDSQSTEEVEEKQNHTYDKAGTYTAKVTVSDDKGNSASDSVEITVESQPSNKPPTVSLSATPTSGEVPLSVELTANATDPDGNTLTYSWDFGDGNKTGNKSKETHMYNNAGTFTVKVTVSDGKGGSATDSTEITVKAVPKNNPPTVSLSATPTNDTSPLTVKFKADASDIDNDTLTYSWDFGDGDKTGGKNKETHTYQQEGTYTAKVTVSDGKGGQSSDTIEIKVNKPPKSNNPPTVQLNATPKTGDSPLAVEFTITANDPDGDSLTIDWDFGDNQTAQGQTSRNHTYQNAGNYTAKVTVSDGKGGTAKDNVQITVTQPPTELVIIKDSQNTVCNILDEITIYGEVMNNSSNTYYSIEVKATIRNKSDQVIDSSSGFVTGTPVKSSLDLNSSGMPPNTKGVFQILTDAPCAEFDVYTLQITKRKGTDNVKGDIQLVGKVTQSTNILGFIGLVGKVQNNGTVRTRFTKIYAVFKNSKGEIVDKDFTFIDGSICPTNIGTTDTCVEVGAKEPFKISTVLEPHEFSSIEYYFDWNESEADEANIQNGNAKIQFIRYNPSGTDAGNEYVDVKALGSVDFNGWYLEDIAGNRVSAPKVTATFGQVVRFQGDKAIWNNDGDTLNFITQMGY